MQRVNKYLLTAIVFLLFLLISQASFAGPKMEFEEVTHDFGKVDQMTKNDYVFLFKNAGDEDLIIKKVKPSCGCTAALISQNELKPGESGKIEVSFNSGKFKNQVKKTVYVETNEEVNVNEKPVLDENNQPIKVHKLYLQAFVNPGEEEQKKLEQERELHMKMSKEQAYLESRGEGEAGKIFTTPANASAEMYPMSMPLGLISMNRDYRSIVKLRGNNSEGVLNITKIETSVPFIAAMINKNSMTAVNPGEIEVIVNVKTPGTLKSGIVYIYIEGIKKPLEFPVSWQTN